MSKTSYFSYLRRFFHHLLRHNRLEKALLLAKDIGSWELYNDICFIASDCGDDQIAQFAKTKSEELRGMFSILLTVT